MIEVGLEPKPKAVVTEPREPEHYLVLGDFGGHAAEPLEINLANFDDVLSRFDVNLAGVRFRELKDLHPDRLYERLEIFHGPQVEPSEVTDDPFHQYMEELALAHSEPQPEEQMRALLHHPRFQEVEAAWRGLDFVVGRADATISHIHIAQLPIDAVAAELEGLLQSRKWRAVIGLYSFGSAPADTALVACIATFAVRAGVPFLAEGWKDMGPRWDELRSSPPAEYIGLALPRFLLRPPYDPQSNPIDSFPFEEMPGPTIHSHYLWGNPALACLALLAGGNGKMELEDLPAPSVETYMSDAEVVDLMDRGLMPLVGFKDSHRLRLARFRAINSAPLPFE